jgi:hypothetical protein
MTSSATQSGLEPSQPAGGTGAATAAGDQSTSTVLGHDGQQQQQQAAPAVDDKTKTGDEGKTPEGEVKAGDDKSKQEAKAPESYAEFKMPEGIQLDAKLLEGATPVLKELKLDQAGAQKLVDVFANHQVAQAKEYGEKLKDEGFALSQVGAVLSHQRESWGKALKSDTEIGGKDFDKNVQVAQRAIARFGSPALKEALDATGLGNHPEFVRFCLKVGHTVSEDNTVLAGAASGSRKSSGEVFYGDSTG